MAGVATVESRRRQGVARALCGLALEDFRGRGGAALYLAHANDAARRLYETMGFACAEGRLMRWVAPGRDFDGEHFAPSAHPRIVPAAWSDMARVIPLYLFPHEWLVLDAKAGIHSNRLRPGNRCVGVFVEVWNAVQAARGAWLLLEAEGGRIVGAATLYPEPGETGLVDFVLHPNHFDAARRLLDALAADARGRGLRRLSCHLAPEDAEKGRLARQNAFGLTTRPPPQPGFVPLAREL